MAEVVECMGVEWFELVAVAWVVACTDAVLSDTIAELVVVVESALVFRLVIDCKRDLDFRDNIPLE